MSRHTLLQNIAESNLSATDKITGTHSALALGNYARYEQCALTAFYGKRALALCVYIYYLANLTTLKVNGGCPVNFKHFTVMMCKSARYRCKASNDTI